MVPVISTVDITGTDITEYLLYSLAYMMGATK